MKKILILLTFFLLFASSACHSSKITNYHFATKKELTDLNREISIKEIKREMRLINDTTNKFSIVKKEMVVLMEEFPIPAFLVLEMQYEKNYLKKISATITYMQFSQKEEYYFKDNNLIAYQITEYKGSDIEKKEIGYAKNFKELKLYINGKKQYPKEDVKKFIVNKVRQSLDGYIPILKSN